MQSNNRFRVCERHKALNNDATEVVIQEVVVLTRPETIGGFSKNLVDIGLSEVCADGPAIGSDEVLILLKVSAVDSSVLDPFSRPFDEPHRWVFVLLNRFVKQWDALEGVEILMRFQHSIKEALLLD